MLSFEKRYALETKCDLMTGLHVKRVIEALMQVLLDEATRWENEDLRHKGVAYTLFVMRDLLEGVPEKHEIN